MATIAPEIWEPYIRAELVRKFNILSSGLVTINPNDPTTQGGTHYTTPYEDNLASHASFEKYDASTTITPTTSSDYKGTVVVAHRGVGTYGLNYNTLIKGLEDTNATTRLQLPEFTLRQIQKSLVNTIKGVFKNTAVKSTHLNSTYKNIGDGLVSFGLFNEVPEQIWGENYDMVNTIICHSKIKNDIYNLIGYDFIPADQIGTDMLYQGNEILNRIDGKTIIVNNELGEQNSDGTYPIYFFAGQPLYLGYQNDLRVFTEFNPAVGGGKESLYAYVDFAPAVKYISWDDTTYDPTDAQLATGTKWAKIGLNDIDKMIGVGRVDVKYSGGSVT